MPTRYYIVPFIVIAFCVTGGYFAFRNDETERKRFSAEKEATISKVDVRRGIDPESGKEYTVDNLVTYGYEIEGTKYERTELMSKLRSSTFVPWGEAKVCFESNDKTSYEKAILIPSDHKCG